MTDPSHDRLDSWKEIAAFLKRNVRTVQRWERIEGLPVHRLQHNSLGSVYALRSELSHWYDSRSVKPASLADEALVTDPSARRRLLVLPFANLSGDASQEFVVDGFTEELITHLAGLQQQHLAVIARSTAMQYKSTLGSIERIVRDLSLDYVIQGSVRREGPTLRISTQLIRATDQTHLWAETYDRDLGSTFAVQREVTEAIARAIHITLSPPTNLRGTRSDNAAAYENYLRGRFHLNRMTVDGLHEAVKYFQQSVQADPLYAIVHANLAHSYALLSSVPFDALPPHDAMPKAHQAALRALDINDQLAEAHFASAVVHHHYHWRWSDAEHAYQSALSLNSDFPRARLQYAWLLLALSRHTEALEHIELAHASVRETDPRALVVTIATRAAAYYFRRDFDRCIAECRSGLELDPGYLLLYYLLARAEIRNGAFDKAAAALKKARFDESTLLMFVGRAMLAAIKGRTKEVRTALDDLLKLTKKRYIPATYIGMLHAGLGDADAAFSWLERAYQERADGLTLLNADPMADSIRNDPRFAPLARRIGLLK
jgi:TolB-like protein/Flp pilus assembly protein TadD